MNAVTSVAWVRRGVAQQRPTKAESNEDDLKKLVRGERESSDDDSDENSEDDDHTPGMAGLTVYSNNADDPYLTKDDPDSDEDEVEIKPDDNVIAVSRVKDELFCLEAWVYNETKKYIYCHHDYILSTCPIVTEWIGFGPGEDSTGNFVAVGTMNPGIELWNLDVMNTLDPVLVLGGSEPERKKRQEKRRRMLPDGHSDAVLDLSWNSLQPHVLASASADSCVGIWDLTDGSCVLLDNLHTDKVQAVQWHPFESQMLLSGSFDHSAKLIDCRSPQGSQRSWKLSGEVEKVLWNSHNACSYFASTNTGHVYCYDVRTDDPLFELKAHKSAVTSLSLSPVIEGCLVTSCEGKSLCVWDVQSNSPKLVEKIKCKIGTLFSAAACPDSQLLLCVGGEREIRILDLKTNKAVTDHFSEINGLQKETTKVKVQEDESKPTKPVKASVKDNKTLRKKNTLSKNKKVKVSKKKQNKQNMSI